jgi:hypothetical protein
MRALTICQPFAWLFTLPATDPRQKRVENRKWATYYRGPVLIHAGKSHEYLATEPSVTECEIEQMPMGAIVARAWLFVCLDKAKIDSGLYDRTRWHWARHHRHTEGPYCHIIGRVETLPKPIFCPGRQSYWVPSMEIVSRVESQIGRQQPPQQT